MHASVVLKARKTGRTFLRQNVIHKNVYLSKYTQIYHPTHKVYNSFNDRLLTLSLK